MRVFGGIHPRCHIITTHNLLFSLEIFMKIALAQMNPVVGDLAGNAAQILTIAQQAQAQQANLLLTPELSLCGYPPRDLLLNPSFIISMDEQVRALATQLPPDLAVLVGVATKNPQPAGKPLLNSTALLFNGQVQQFFHKQLLPTYDVFDENRYFEAGENSNFFLLHNYKIGVTICEDLWNDEDFWGKRQYLVNPIAELAVQGVNLIVNLSASPYTLGKQPVREAMLQHAAQRHQQPILYVNQVGANDDLIFDGGSMGCNRQGQIMTRSPSFVTDLSIVEFSQGDLQPGVMARSIDSPDEEIWQALVLGVKDYAHKCGFRQVILGLSGGIDSALVAAIAAAAVGADQVLGVLMPSPYSSAHSITDAIALSQNLGIQTTQLPIQELMVGFDRTLAPLFANTEFGIAEENIQSRIRGNLLMAIANKFGHLLLSTGNKSEMAVGYCTLYGDMNGGLAVIADVPKTRVYALCRWLNRHQELIPTNIIDKPPSAELKPGQVDQDSLPSYEILDNLLEKIIYEHRSTTELIAQGFDPTVVKKITQLLQRAEFKRRQAPPGLKITDRAFGTGWRMPIAARLNA
jgi:NAD+ synthase (glutamine-hydrolysing)